MIILFKFIRIIGKVFYNVANIIYSDLQNKINILNQIDSHTICNYYLAFLFSKQTFT